MCLWRRSTTFKDKLPIFGVCLGHQTIVQYFGGIDQVMPPRTYARQALARRTQRARDCSQGIENPLQAGRYHSLDGPARCPTAWRSTAEFEGIVMGIRAQGTAHLRRPVPPRKHFDAGRRPDYRKRVCKSRPTNDKLKVGELNMANDYRNTWKSCWMEKT